MKQTVMFGKSTGLLVLLVVSEVLSLERFHTQYKHCDVGTSCLSRSSCKRDVCASEPASCDGAGCDISRWSLVYEHDAKGEAVYGRRENLVAALRDGATMTMILDFWDEPYTSQADHVHIEQGNVCAQFWKHASFSNWMSFQTNVYWWIIIVCTSGYGQATRYYVGGDFLSSNNYSFAVQWYVKYPYTLRPVLTLDAAGWVESGTIAALQEAVLAGKAMYALIGNDTQTDLLPLNNVGVKKSHVNAQSINRVSTKKCKDGRCQYSDSAIWLSYLFSTAGGDVVVTRRALDTATRLADVHRQAAVSWLVDDCWTLALVHDGAGQVEQGSLECLRGAVRAGHRVRVRLPGLQDNVAEADGLQIRNGVVSGYFLSLFSDDNDVLPDIAPAHATHAVWLTVSTSGIVRIRRQKLGSTEAGKKTKRAFDCIMWFIDTRPWELALSVDAKGTVTGGSKVALVEAVKRGASVRYAARFAADDLSLVGANNLHVNGNDVSAQNTVSISLTTAADNADDIDFQNNPYWYLTIVTTTGRYEASRWTYGRHESRTQDVKHFPIDWFILY